MKAILIIFTLSLIFSACGKKGRDAVPSGILQRHEFKGKIVEISDKEKKIAKIQHEEVKGFMSAMTMKFPIKDDTNFDKLAVGDNITATLIYNPNDNRSWLENLVITKGDAPSNISPANPSTTASATPAH